MSQTPQVEPNDPQIRLQTIESLMKIGGAVAIPKLVYMLIDTDETVRKTARASLEKMDPNWAKSDAAKRAVPALEMALHDDNYWVGLEANAVLKMIAGEVQETAKEEKTTITDKYFHQKREAARILASALKESDADFRLAAAETLGRIGNVGFAEPLAVALTDADEWVRWHAANSLQAIGWQPPDEKQKALYFVVLRKWDEVEKLGAEVIDPLIFSLKSSNGKVRENAANQLARFKEARSVEPLAECLNDKHKSVRKAAAKALSAIGAKNLSMEQRNLMVEALRA